MSSSNSSSSGSSLAVGADRKRICGPAVSLQPLPPLDHSILSGPLLNKGDRRDGRPFEAIRPIFMRTGVIFPANGSAYLEAGKVKITAAVYGPRSDRRQSSTERGRLALDFRFAPFAHDKRSGYLRTADEKHFSALLSNALLPAVVLEAFPKATVDVCITVLEADGCASGLALAVTAASMALADAGIEMLDMVAGSSAALGASLIAPLLDPTREEEELHEATMFVALMPSINQVTQIMQRGEIDQDMATEVMEQCVECCTYVREEMRRRLIERCNLASTAKAVPQTTLKVPVNIDLD